jgi:hypothetical protein
MWCGFIWLSTGTSGGLSGSSCVLSLSWFLLISFYDQPAKHNFTYRLGIAEVAFMKVTFQCGVGVYV